MKRPGTPTYPKTCGPEELEPHYSHHVGAITEEGLHHKQDIAFQLALRDKQIDDLQTELDDAWRNDHPVTNDEMIRRLEAQLELHLHDPGHPGPRRTRNQQERRPRRLMGGPVFASYLIAIGLALFVLWLVYVAAVNGHLPPGNE